MKATELMIGDWVEYGAYITTVRNLSDKIVLSGCVGRLDEVHPVQITERILEKNGFVFTKEKYILSNKKIEEVELYKAEIENHTLEVHIADFSIWYDGFPKGGKRHFAKLCIYDNDFPGDTSCAIDYVHQLQHALRLCGIEKEIII